MKKFLIINLLLLLSCGKENNSDNPDNFFLNQSQKIWSYTEINSSGSETRYISFLNGTMHYILFSDGKQYCYKKFLGKINNISHPIDGFQCNISNQIVSNKLNELQIETTVTDTEGVFKYNYIVTLLVNGDNLSYFNQEDDAKYIGFVAKVYNGDLSLDFNDCEVDYIL
tara:strand:+ start:481 stop:987 length:507 start_codon:yes stop_codon:yes gene_type:complete